MSDCLLATLSVRPHLLRQQILLQDYFSVGREYIFIRNLDSRHSTFRLVLQFPAKNVFSQPNDLGFTSLPIGQAEGTIEAVFNASSYLRRLHEFRESLCTWVSELALSTGLSPPGELCKWKSDHCQAAWKDSFPCSSAVISGLPPTHHFPTSHPSALVSQGSFCPSSAEEKLINASTSLSLLHCGPLRRLSDGS